MDTCDTNDSTEQKFIKHIWELRDLCALENNINEKETDLTTIWRTVGKATSENCQIL